MSETSMPVEGGDNEPGRQPRGHGTVVFGGMLVALGVALLLAQTHALPVGWRTTIWPVLLMLFGATRLLQVTRHGREGLFAIVAGAWWLAGLQGWLSLTRTWPVLIVGLGASVMLQAITAPPREMRLAHHFPKRHSGGAPWILLAILAGAVMTTERPDALSRLLTPDDDVSVVTVAGRGHRDVEGAGFKKGDLVAVMGRSVLDLTKATVEPGETVKVDVMTFWGSSTIRVPEGWTVDVNAVAAFGAIRDNRADLRDADPGDRASDSPQTGPRVVVDGLVMMGSLTITS